MLVSVVNYMQKSHAAISYEEHQCWHLPILASGIWFIIPPIDVTSSAAVETKILANSKSNHNRRTRTSSIIHQIKATNLKIQKQSDAGTEKLYNWRYRNVSMATFLK